MKIRQRLSFAVVAAVIASLALASTALAAAVVIHEGRGAGKARLGQIDTVAALYLGKHTGLQRDSNYGSRVVYWLNFGTRIGDGRYPCELLSDSKHHVFQFSFNSPAYVTGKGIKVGSRESQLTAAYTGLKRIHTPKFNHYILGKRPFTDFWVLNATGRVYQIIVRSK
ncbi:MAG: hypothetical protein ABSC51_07300 [Gaiellaceae bacterium]|jgi:hypothetical protein